MLDVFNNEFVKNVRKYSNFVLLFGGNFYQDEAFKVFDDRCFNLGIDGSNVFLGAAGFFVRGNMPFIICSSKMAMDSYKDIRDGICTPNLNIKIVCVGSENFEDVEIMKLLPNMKVLVADNVSDITALFEEAFSCYGPVYLRLKS